MKEEKARFSLAKLSHNVAEKLRRHEFEKARGNMPLLEQVEHTSDAALLQKWGWKATIAAAIFSFLGMPLAITVLQPIVPELINNMLWFAAKLSMGMSLLVLAVSIYFTTGMDSNRK